MGDGDALPSSPFIHFFLAKIRPNFRIFFNVTSLSSSFFLFKEEDRGRGGGIPPTSMCKTSCYFFPLLLLVRFLLLVLLVAAAVVAVPFVTATVEAAAAASNVAPSDWMATSVAASSRRFTKKTNYSNNDWKIYLRIHLWKPSLTAISRSNTGSRPISEIKQSRTGQYLNG